MLPDLRALEEAAEIVSRTMSPTPQYLWPSLVQKLGLEVWLKHENHTPLGAFKVRGGLVYFAKNEVVLRASKGVMCATRGNHGQSVAFAARQYGIDCTIVVPHGNSQEKNSAMRALGAELVEYGQDFQESLEFAQDRAQEEDLVMVPSFDPLLVAGVGTYSMELLRAVPDIDALYVPIGLGSGICGAMAARDALDLRTEIVGVVSDQAQAYRLSFESQTEIESPVATRIADGMACRKPIPEALQCICEGVSRVVQVSDAQVEQAMRDIFQTTHNVTEGAGAAAVAAVTQDAKLLKGKRIAAVLCGANVDSEVFAKVLAER